MDVSLLYGIEGCFIYGMISRFYCSCWFIPKLSFDVLAFTKKDQKKQEFSWEERKEEDLELMVQR